ncbi:MULTISPECIES: hypothetical protein [Nocardia]|uniref:Uncharacterized protein n=1 Tax=Nocardia nova TaxID=37330 RepID=A0A2T2Z8C4_9NOCA|nr:MULTISPECIES: hypothetical protein [Nocardia]PSR64012.1 hypothetical protein C8259_09200 [Nocardia nova]
MTVISDKITDIAGLGETDNVVFETITIRDNIGETAIVTTRRHSYAPGEDGTFTTDDLDPGPARVRVGLSTYNIEIPDTSDAIRLMPLIEAALPMPPAETAAAVHNFGGVSGMKAVTQSWWDSNPHDPATFYIVLPD